MVNVAEGALVNEPSNWTAWVDRSGDTWVRVDDCPGQYGTWWPVTDGPGWDKHARGGVGQARTWDQVLVDWPELTAADSERTAQALRLVREEFAR